MSEKTTLDYLGRFQNIKLQEKFILYCLQQRSKFSYVTITVMIVIWAIAESVASMWFYDEAFTDSRPEEEETYGITSLILSIAATIVCAVLCFSLLGRVNPLIYSYFQAGLIVLLNLIFIIKTIKRINLGSAVCLPSQLDIVGLVNRSLPPNLSAEQRAIVSTLLELANFPPACPPDNSFTSLVNNQAVVIMGFCPQLLMAIIHEPRLYLMYSCHFISAALVLYSTYTSFYSLVPLMSIYLIVSILLGELHFQRVQSFLNQLKIKHLLEENERNADENHATEMRHMIGNVAHDLKTPLSSFTNGVDLIRDILQSACDKANGKNMTPEVFTDCFSSIQTCLMNIRNTNAFMLMTINRCIDYTKASKGMKLVPKYETVDLREALQFPIECMSNIQERIGIKLEAMSEEICSHIITDKQWLQENLLCLLSNAVKYSSEGSVTITGTLRHSQTLAAPIERSIMSKQSSVHMNKIAPTISEDGEYETSTFLVFEIEDNGIGLSDEAMKNLFNPFRQAQRLAGGTGLGLYSLAKRMEALKGSYGVRKRKDGKQGSLFWFAIPYKADTFLSSSAHELLETTARNVSPVQRPYHLRSSFLSNSASKDINSEPCMRNIEMTSNSVPTKLEILIVDDAPSIVKMSTMMLKRQGHQIWTAENGEIALKRIEEKWRGSGKGFDLVLMDLQMPVMDGLEATRRLRAMEAEGREWMLPSIRTPRNGTCVGSAHQVVIGLSANSDHDTTKDAFTAGVDDFFAKPFTIETFNRTVSRYVSIRCRDD